MTLMHILDIIYGGKQVNFSKNVVTNEGEIIDTLLQNHTPDELEI